MKISDIHILTLIPLLLCLLVSAGMAKSNDLSISYELALSFEIDKQQLIGTAHLVLPPNHDLSLILSPVEVSRIVLNQPSTPPAIINHQGVSHLKLPVAKVQQEIFISYTKKIDNLGENILTDKGITLLHGWYPYPTNNVEFTTIAELPKGFTAIVESDYLADSRQSPQRFKFSKKTQNLHFVAAPFIINSLKVRDGLRVYTYFQSDNQDLSADYLRAAKEYLLRYEKLIGEYPYNHFAIVENVLPTGYGMPTFTLLGKSVIRLPFIKDTSLGHEILHSWFGNAIEVAEGSGNWAEGLTSYMADWLYREDKQQGGVNRKEQILKYLSYVSKDTAIPLRSFTSASHNQPMARSVRSVGYIKGAFIFHELRETYGETLFYKALQSFYSRFRDKKASWKDIQEVFEHTTGASLVSFFEQRLDRPTIPDFTIDNLKYDIVSEPNTLSFAVKQHTDEPYIFSLPITVDTTTGPVYFQKQIQTASENIVLKLNSPPIKLSIDPEYDLLRTLHQEERVVSWSFFMGPNPIWVIPEAENETIYDKFLEFFRKKNWEIKDPGTYGKSDLTSHNLILLGVDNPVTKSYFGAMAKPAKGIVIEARKHPLNRDKSVLLVSATDQEQVELVLRKLSHYGKYSYLSFVDGKIVDRDIKPGHMGINYSLADEPQIMPTNRVQSFNETMGEIGEAKVIYIGETHTSMTDHHLQYRVIENLYNRNKNIAIGMEMFLASSQKVLDEYVARESTMTERDFLKESRYFDVWRFDYRYYRKIINFARERGIPLVGLNIEREVVSSIFKHGSSDQLTPEQLQKFPKEMDLSLPGYYERLNSMYSLHLHGGHGKGNVGGFIQAQATWDEVMADNIAKYISAIPATQMIVLAGSQHTRKDSGIPPRVKRRLDVPQVTLHSANDSEKPSEQLADFVIYLDELRLPPAGKIGISLEEMEENGDNFVKITGLTTGGNAGKAGLRRGDILHTIDGYAIKDMEDIRIALVGALPGDIVQVELRRSSFGLEPEELEFGVELHAPID